MEGLVFLLLFDVRESLVLLLLVGLTDSSSPLSRWKVPRAAPPSIIITLIPPSWSCLASDQRVSYIASLGGWSFRLMSPGCSFRCTAESKT